MKVPPLLIFFFLDQNEFILFNVVLVAPEIPPNTGNIIRLCANSGCALHLVEPLGFKLDDARLKRAGLDYREGVDIRVYGSFDHLVNVHPDRRILLFSKFYQTPYSEMRYRSGDFLVFGSETSGLPEEIHGLFQNEQKLTLPMMPDSRSLNLANAVAVVVYEAWRQNGFEQSTFSAKG